MRLVDARLLQEDKVLREAKVVGITRDEVEPTLRYVSRLANIPLEDFHYVGSTGKAEYSGDIDVAIDENRFTPFKIHDRLSKQLGSENAVFNKGTNIGSYAVPIAGNESDEKVQVDIMFVDNIDWAKFSYFSAGDKSKYKGAVRAVLLSAVAASLEEPGIDAFHYVDGELIVRVGRGIDMAKGLKRLFQMRTHRKYGEGYVKALKNVSPDEIKRYHSDLEFDGDDVIIDDPLQVVQILFGEGTRPSNVDTAEEVLDLISKFPQKRRNKILNIARIRGRQLASKGIALPEEIQ
jgi:hypothetical protein